MAVRTLNRRGKRVLLIDITYRKPDGRIARFRRDTKAVTKSAARREEQRIRDLIAKTGSPYESLVDDSGGNGNGNGNGNGDQQAPEPTFAQVVEDYRALIMPSRLKAATRTSYDAVIDREFLPRFAELPISQVDGLAATRLDVELANGKTRNGTKFKQGTRNNIQIVLRAILSYAERRKLIAQKPTDLPPLKRIGKAILEIPSDEQIKAIMALAHSAHRRSFGLMAYAGLRPHELRALRRRDLTFEMDGSRVAGGFVAVRDGMTDGQIHAPKTGQRQIPMAPPLVKLLEPTVKLGRKAFVAISARGTPWCKYGLYQAFLRVRQRAGFEGFSVYTLRHYAITSWLRAGVPVHVVQRMAGHNNLSTTQGYVHYVKTDLIEAAHRLGHIWATGDDEDKKSEQ